MPKPALKIRCSCGRNLAWAYRPAGDLGRGLTGVVQTRPGVTWTEVPAEFTRPGGLAAAGWIFVCPACSTRHYLNSGVVRNAVANGDDVLPVGD